jgi:uncharacterized damage-inducible protein DinB
MRTLLLFMTAGSVPLWAQASANPLAADAKSTYELIKRNIKRSAEKMPEEHWSFKPTPEVRTYGQILAHIADANFMICASARGEKRDPVIEKTKTTRTEIVQALDESFVYCDADYNGLTDKSAAEMVKFFGRDRTRIGALNFNVAHDFEHYGNLVTYMRMKGIVPPSSEPRPPAGRSN